MYEVGCLDLTTGKRFYLHFESLFLVKKFINKGKRGKKLKITLFPNET